MASKQGLTAYSADRDRCLAALVRRLGERTVTVHDDDRNRLAQARASAIARREPYAAEFRLVSGRRSTGMQEVVFAFDRGGPDEHWVGTQLPTMRRHVAAGRAYPLSDLQAVIDAARIGMWTVDVATGAWAWSNEFRAILGVSAKAAPGWDAFLERVHPDDRALLHGADASRPMALPDATFRILRADDEEPAWLVSASRAVLDTQGRPERVIGSIQDISDRKRAEREREASEIRLNTALKIGRMVVWDLDLGSGIVSRSTNADEVLGSRREPITNFVGRVHPADRHMVTWESSDNPTPPPDDIRFRYLHPNGAQLWLESSAIKIATENARGHIVGITVDVTERQMYEDKLIHAANHDPLTGLLNRKAWNHVLDHAVTPPVGTNARGFCLVLLDIDHFKSINDVLGHGAGDEVLRTIGERILTIPEVEVAARLGGDEFAACLNVDPAGALEAADRILAAVAQPIPFGERTIVTSGSIGLATFPQDAAATGDLVKNADLALYAVKQGGRGHARLFEPQMRATLDSRLALETEFRLALDAGQIVPFYQPKFDLLSGRLVGFEALARWICPKRGVLTPAVFGAIFDDGEIARRLGTVMRSAVIADLCRWRAQRLDVGRIAVNCSAHDFRLSGLSGLILDEWAAAGLPASLLEIEVTEGVMVGRHAEAVALTLDQLHAAGVKISLDDFGTGYASLIHLKQFPVDEIKLDRSFVADMERPPNPAIIRAVLAMGSSLGITTVAEGVETKAQAEALREMGCQQAQGYLFSKPMSASRVPWFVRTGTEKFRVDPAGHRQAG